MKLNLPERKPVKIYNSPNNAGQNYWNIEFSVREAKEACKYSYSQEPQCIVTMLDIVVWYESKGLWQDYR